jgi:hypothetical protein
MNGDPLDFQSAMALDYTNWNPAVKAEIQSQVEKGTFSITLESQEGPSLVCGPEQVCASLPGK